MYFVRYLIVKFQNLSGIQPDGIVHVVAMALQIQLELLDFGFPVHNQRQHSTNVFLDAIEGQRRLVCYDVHVFRDFLRG